MSIVEIILPLLLVAACGYGASRSRWFSAEMVKGVSVLAFYICIPALLFSAMLKVPLESSLNPAVLMAFYLPVVSVFLVTLAVAALIGTRGVKQSAVLGLGGSYSNTLLVGLPVIIAAYGEAQMANVFLIIPFHSAVLFGLTFVISGFGKPLELIKSLVFNPVVSSIGLGLLGNVLGLSLPVTLDAALEMLAKPAIPCALFVLGANLNQYRLSGAMTSVVSLSMVKLMLLPAMVYWLGSSLELSSLERAVTVLLAASPLGVNAYLIAVQVKQHEKEIAGAVVLSSTLAVVSVSFWLWVLT
ncbi:AEC family transporter [Shewanella submarina]|uniref:AEC family transporter n=1 Tax=Shewanella submarina TaxID=2016376 RepID=A0ABV7GFH8_9GAMM|nr:AEC family transporter [Shewanella submarina]MCL1037669.1 AEC family transporter [Shewanella submarina]